MSSCSRWKATQYQRANNDKDSTGNKLSRPTQTYLDEQNNAYNDQLKSSG